MVSVQPRCAIACIITCAHLKIDTYKSTLIVAFLLDRFEIPDRNDNQTPQNVTGSEIPGMIMRDVKTGTGWLEIPGKIPDMDPKT